MRLPLNRRFRSSGFRASPRRISQFSRRFVAATGRVGLHALALRGLTLTSVVCISASGAAIGLLIIYIDWPFPNDAATFTGSDAYKLWVSLICLDMAIWALLLLPIGDSLRLLTKYWRGNIRVVCTSLGVYSVLLVGFVVV